MNILEEIFANKRGEVVRQKQIRPLAELRAEAEQSGTTIDFIAALQAAKTEAGCPALIAEVKRASPSHGQIAADLDPADLACLYADNGAAAISVLTDERYFNGSLTDLERVAAALKGSQLPEYQRPLLRKDFIFDPYQVYESRCHGADAILLIAAALDRACLADLQTLAYDLHMAALVEVHNLAELELALICEASLIGINNRNLKDFSVDLVTTLRLRSFVPGDVCLVSESGIHTPADVSRLAAAGVDAILVGEALVAAPDVPAAARALSGR